VEYFYIFILLFVILAGWRLIKLTIRNIEIREKYEKERKKHGTSARRYRMARLPD
jgi:hypothetical protein